MVKHKVYKKEIHISSMKLVLVFCLLSVFMISFASAFLGDFKQNTCVDIKTIMNTSSVTIATLSYPNSTVALSNQAMTKDGLNFNYTFCDTNTLGTYTYSYYDADGSGWVNDFNINDRTNDNSPNYYYIILALVIVVISLGIILRNNPIMMLGSFGLVFIGLNIVIYGINGIKDGIYSWAIGIILLAIGGYCGIKSGMDMIMEGDD